MPNRPMRLCAEPGCGKASSSKYCEDHRKENSHKQAERYRHSDPIWKMYNANWERLRDSLKTFDPICRRLVEYKGRKEQCRNPATHAHHIISPRVRPDLMVDPANIIMVCDHCHPNSDGELDPRPETIAKLYVPSNYRLPTSF